jgi:hypothetical protein
VAVIEAASDPAAKFEEYRWERRLLSPRYIHICLSASPNCDGVTAAWVWRRQALDSAAKQPNRDRTLKLTVRRLCRAAHFCARVSRKPAKEAVAAHL